MGDSANPSCVAPDCSQPSSCLLAFGGPSAPSSEPRQGVVPRGGGLPRTEQLGTSSLGTFLCPCLPQPRELGQCRPPPHPGQPPACLLPCPHTQPWALSPLCVPLPQDCWALFPRHPHLVHRGPQGQPSLALQSTKHPRWARKAPSHIPGAGQAGPLPGVLGASRAEMTREAQVSRGDPLLEEEGPVQAFR